MQATRSFVVRSCRAIIVASAALAIAAPAASQVGHDDLVNRLGQGNVPTGSGVVVGQVEALVSGNYRPNPSNSEFSGKTFLLMSGLSGNSNHATTVGRNFYGLDTSIAPGINLVYCYFAAAGTFENLLGWVGNDLLRTNAGAGVPPHPSPIGIKIFNNSWVGDLGPTLTNDAIRRADFLAQRDDVLIINGVWTENPHVPLMSNTYNGIAVGRSNGAHAWTDTAGIYDGPGRMKPELVAPHSATSWSTAMVSSAAALMVETARTPPLDQNPLAERSEVIKAVLLGGAKRGSTWTNNPVQSGAARGQTLRPIDDVVGAGEVNVNTAHLMLTGGQFAATSAQATAPHLCRRGWDLTSLAGQEQRYWRFRLPHASETVNIVATWHRAVDPANMGSWTMPVHLLRLWRIDESGAAVSLIGPAGEPYFSGGNVSSTSTVDNVQLLHIQNLQPGDYLIELRRSGTGGSHDVAVAWLMDAAIRSGDLTGSGTVGVPDLLQLLSAWGQCPDGVAGCTGDLTCSGSVGVADLLLLLSDWG